MNLTELNIQSKIRGSDIREFERMFGQYYEPLCRHANKILNDMDTAEDLVQEFFYQFWKNRASFTVRLSLKAYLYQSIRNNALHHLEHLAVRKAYENRIISESGADDEAQMQTETELNDLADIVNKTLQRMPERCSRIFRMNRFDGRKYREIADILSISVKTVEADMGKALQMFRVSLREFNGDRRNSRH
jgi:RNA polymerase sigma-70 factor (ECF subfamily)